MDNYTFQEHANMHAILGEAYGNGAAAIRFYTETHPQRRLVNPQMFNTTDCHIRENGIVCTSLID
jgi:hypothetical protein